METMYALNFYSPIVADQLRSHRKTATIRLGDKSGKYKKGMIVSVLCGARYGARERIFKVVSFFLIRYERGRLGDIPEAFRHEVAEAKWLPLDEAPRLLAYGGEREMAKKAIEQLAGQDV